MYGGPQREIKNNQTGNSAFPFLYLSQRALQKSYALQPDLHFSHGTAVSGAQGGR